MTAFASAFLLWILGVIAACTLPRRAAAAASWGLITAGCALMATAAGATLAHGTSIPLAQLALPLIGPLDFELTPLAGLFLLVTTAVFAAALPFQLRDSLEWPRLRGGAFLAFVILTLMAMVALFTAASVVSFVVAWEIAAFAIWALIGFETRRAEPVAAGLLTIALSEAGSLAGLAGLLLLGLAAHSSSLDGIARAAPELPPTIAIAGCILTFFGFGMKAGVVPLNLWLPDAHGAAPRSVSPILSAATLNLGLYAFLRLDAPLARTDSRLGLMILATGAMTALTGIMYALTERNLKRLLAQSSIENIGIATAGFGAGFTFAALGHPVFGGLALVAGLYHMINHSAYKALLFLGAGGIDAATGTHDLDRLGGVLRRLPVLGTLFVIGTFAIAALPPMNGFVSEWMLLQSLLRVVEVGPIPVRIVFALTGAALALTAGLAVTCFAMTAATALLGLPRSRGAAAARRAARSVWIPMSLLALICFGLALWVTGVTPVLGHVAAPLVGADPTNAIVPDFFGHETTLAAATVRDLSELGAQLGRGLLPLRGLVVLHTDGVQGSVTYAMSTVLTFLVLAFLLLLVWAATRGAWRHRRVSRGVPWNAGIVRLRPEMAYTATAFASPVRVLFHAVFDPNVARKEQRQGAFVTAHTHFEIRINVVDRLFIRPAVKAAQRVASLLAELHQGKVTSYAGYVLVALVVALLAAQGTSPP